MIINFNINITQVTQSIIFYYNHDSQTDPEYGLYTKINSLNINLHVIRHIVIIKQLKIMHYRL